MTSPLQSRFYPSITFPIDSLLGYEKKYYLEVYLDNYADKITDKEMADYFDNNFFGTIKITFW